MEGLKAGDTVRLKKNAVSYNGRIISGKLKKENWTVTEIRDDRVWLELEANIHGQKASLTVNRKNIQRAAGKPASVTEGGRT